MLYTLSKNDNITHPMISKEHAMILLEDQRTRCAIAGQQFQWIDVNGTVTAKFFNDSYTLEPILKYANQNKRQK